MQLQMTCDKCKVDFTVHQPGVERIQDDIERTFFPCPACGKEYTSFYTNEGIRRMQATLQNLTGKPGKKNVRLRLDLRKRIGVGMERLRQEVEHE